MIVRSKVTQTIKRKTEKPIILCYEGDILNVTADHGNVLIVFKDGYFPIKKSEIEDIDMTKEKLLEVVKHTVSRVKDSDHFPFAILSGILENKIWKPDFINMVKDSDINEPFKNKILDEINK